jgi:hypothetical protein
MALGLLAAAVAAAIPAVPPIPSLPNVHIPGEKVERFKLVFDGESHAGRIPTLTGQTGGCDVTLNGDIEEGAEFGRGKGVTMEFVSYREKGHTRYGFQRSGRNLESSFTVVADIFRQATGTGSLSQHPDSVQCPTQSFELNQDADCGKTITNRVPWGLRVKGATFSPRPVGVGSLASVDRCGEPPQGSPFSDDIADLNYGWDTPPVLPFEPIPLHKMFNSHFHAFKVEFKVPPYRRATGTFGTPPLQGTTADSGWIEATVRFIRQ